MPQRFPLELDEMYQPDSPPGSVETLYGVREALAALFSGPITGGGSQEIRTWMRVFYPNQRTTEFLHSTLDCVDPPLSYYNLHNVTIERIFREGRGFTLAELKEAGIGRKEARGVGIVVDHRRRNLSEEGKKVNVERLKAYKARLVVFPRKAGKPKKGDSSVDELKASFTRDSLALPDISPAEPPRKITAAEREFQAYKTLRTARANARHEGARKARAAKAKEEEAAKKK
ncbi:hypothetical protein NLJ89_g7708 [Agrocybe chaxingu]|uniref:60S ribosomal protein L13 n=1 Tax=Agrocybe chaxingu TaxID=84603 RepID=A0A9W8JW44_9AGAR|nr:hypothetical protein NLJ89_g7708 [Agrocybe chaxingu]